MLATGPFIFWYGARFVLFGVRWGVNSTFAMAGPVLTGLAPSWRWVPCPSADLRECGLRFCHANGVGISWTRAAGHTSHCMCEAAFTTAFTVQAQPQGGVYSPILHYFSTFVQQEPAFI